MENLSTNNKDNGCEIINDLWQVALRCNIKNPGVGGSTSRMVGFIECTNLRDFMTIATMKCWHERGSTEMPPIIVSDTDDVSKSNTVDKTTGSKK